MSTSLLANLFVSLLAGLSYNPAFQNFTARSKNVLEPTQLFLGDMIWETGSLELTQALEHGQHFGTEFETKGAVKARLIPWEDGVLPLVFAKSINALEQEKIFKACREWESVADVRCVRGSYKGRKLKVSKKLPGCWSLWGMGRHLLVFRRQMNLSSNCWRHDTLLHELGHAFGLIHEHQRPDRDNHVELFPKNTDRGFLGLNYKVNFDHQDSELATPYDYRSIMHYTRNAFSKNGKDTLLPKEPYRGDFADIIGRLPHISDSDASTLSLLYGLPKQTH